MFIQLLTLQKEAHMRNLIFIFSFLFFVADTNAQNPRPKVEKKPFWEKVYFGGNIGLQFGNLTLIDVSPLMGYKVTDKLSVGVGITYRYYRYKDPTYTFSTSIYGGSIFSRYLLTDNIFTHAEYEMLNMEAYDRFKKRVWVPILLVGGGYNQRLSDRAVLSALILWTFTESVYSPYQNPVIRVGVNIGL